jgi:hypothetical protein
MITNCANPACRTSFDHRIRGTFFRFRLMEAEVLVIPEATHNAHQVIHYWLCPVCSKIFSLSHVETGKVVLRFREQGFEVAPPQVLLTAAQFLVPSRGKLVTHSTSDWSV